MELASNPSLFVAKAEHLTGGLKMWPDATAAAVFEIGRQERGVPCVLAGRDALDQHFEDVGRLAPGDRLSLARGFARRIALAKGVLINDACCLLDQLAGDY
jgi:hypothetical protein